MQRRGFVYIRGESRVVFIWFILYVMAPQNLAIVPQNTSLTYFYISWSFCGLYSIMQRRGFVYIRGESRVVFIWFILYVMAPRNLAIVPQNTSSTCFHYS